MYIHRAQHSRLISQQAYPDSERMKKSDTRRRRSCNEASQGASNRILLDIRFTQNSIDIDEPKHSVRSAIENKNSQFRVSNKPKTRQRKNLSMLSTLEQDKIKMKYKKSSSISQPSTSEQQDQLPFFNRVSSHRNKRTHYNKIMRKMSVYL